MTKSTMRYDPFSKTNHYIIDGLIVGTAFWLAYQIRFEGAVPPDNRFQLWLLLPVVIASRLVTNTLFGTYQQMWRYVSIVDAIHITRSYAAFSSLLLLVRVGLPEKWTLLRIPLSVIAIEFLLSLFGVLIARSLRRIQYQQGSRQGANSQGQRRVLLLGAGAAGVITAKDLLLREDRQIVGFLDDNPRKLRATINGIPVLGPLHCLPQVVKEHGVDEVVLCLGRAPIETLKRIWRLCEGLAVRTLIIPSSDEIFDGEVQVTRLRQMTMEDLLGRETVNLSHDPVLLSYYEGKRILITGAGGSIGSELTRQLSGFESVELLLLDKDENGLYELQHQLEARDPKPRCKLIVADIRSRERIRSSFREFRPQIVFHAAAYKHVPLMESNPGEAILNNVFGTKNVVEQALESECSFVVLVSTDKAVKPSSIMGATKRVAELIVQDKQECARPHFACVRFGNVMSSRGSVIPLFQKQIAAGGPVTLTDPEMTRYFMTIPEAVQLLIHVPRIDRSDRATTFVLDMGDPVRIADLARDLIELSGLRPGYDIRVETIGLRPGEKLREELVVEGESLIPTEQPRILAVYSPPSKRPSHLDALLGQLWEAAHRDDKEEIYRVLEEFNFGFQASALGSSETLKGEVVEVETTDT